MRKALYLAVLALVSMASALPAAEQRYVAFEQPDEAWEVRADVISSSIDEVIIEIRVPGFSVDATETERGLLSRVEIGGCGRTVDIGRAALPVFRRAVEIPQGAQPELEILERTATAYDLDRLGVPRSIYPAQPPVEKLPGAREAAGFAYSDDFYASPAPYPAMEAMITGTGQLRGHRFATLEVAPVIYRPAQGTIEVLKRIVVRIRTTGADAARTRAAIERYASPPFERSASAALLNYQAPAAVPALPVGYLIITDPLYADEIQPLADWKTAKGYASTVTSTSRWPSTRVIGATVRVVAIVVFLYRMRGDRVDQSSSAPGPLSV